MRNLPQTVFLASALLGLAGVTLLTAYAAGGAQEEWTTDTQTDFIQGTLDGVDVWSDSGAARLDHRWWPNGRVNDDEAESQVYPRLTFAISRTGDLTETHFLAVWEDERSCDHCPDIYFAGSTDGGHTWSANVMIQNSCNPSAPPYPDCACLFTPDIAVRRADGSLWVVWQQDPGYADVGPDDGDIYYAVSTDEGQTWSIATAIYDGDGLQSYPRIASHAQSGYLYVVWEDERDDEGDIYISRFNPDTDTAWSAPLKISDDTTGAEQRRPALAVDAGGNIYVAWEDEREDVYGDVYFTRRLAGSDWDGAAWSANTRLDDADADWGDEPALAIAGGDTLLAAWRERVGTTYPDRALSKGLSPLDPTFDWQIVVAVSRDRGQTWSRTVADRLYDASATLAYYSEPALAAGTQDRLYLAWVHCSDPFDNQANVLVAQSPDGGAHWTEPQIVSLPPNSVNEATRPALTADFDGRVVVAWHDYRDAVGDEIYATGYPATGYLPRGEYRRQLDAGTSVGWGTFRWTVTTAADANLVLATRVMTTAGAGWTAWVTHTTSGETLTHPAGRFLQYRAVFTSNGNNTPALDEVVVTYEGGYRFFLPLVVRDYSGEIDVTQLVETDDDILGISDLVPDPYADVMAAGARVVNLEPLQTFFVLWVPPGYEEMENRRVMVIAHGHTGNAYREVGLELDFPGEPDYAIVAIQWWTGVDEVMYTGQQYYEFMDVALRYMEYKYHAQPDKCALRGWSFGSEISYEVTYLDRSSGNNRLALTISHDGFMRPDPDEMSVGKEFTRNLYDGLYGTTAFSGTHFYLYSGATHSNITNTMQVITDFGGVVEQMVIDGDAGHDGFYIHPQYHEEAVSIFINLTTP